VGTPEDNATLPGTRVYTWVADDLVFLLIGTDEAQNLAMVGGLPGEAPPTSSPVPSASGSQRGALLLMTESGDWGDDARDDRLSASVTGCPPPLRRLDPLCPRQRESGVPVSEIAGLTGMTTRTVYRDIKALEEELAMPIFQAGKALWDREEVLPPAAPSLGPRGGRPLPGVPPHRALVGRLRPGGGQRLHQAADLLPQPIARHVAATMLIVGQAEPNDQFVRNFAHVAQAWADGRVVEFEYESGEGERRKAACTYFLEPDAAGRSVYLIGFDEDGQGDADLQGGADPQLDAHDGPLPDPRRLRPGPLARPLMGDLVVRHHRDRERPPAVRGVGREPRPRGRLAPLAARHRPARWPGRDDRDGGRHRRDPSLDPLVGDGVEVLEPPELREAVARAVEAAAARYRG
jgi:hypothetical protein